MIRYFHTQYFAVRQQLDGSRPFMLLLVLPWILLVFIHPNTVAQSASARAEAWADSILTRMSLDDKIGQLFMIRAHSDLGDDHVQSVLRQIKKYRVGGLCFFQGTPEKQATLTARYQKESHLPLLVSMDAEWGLGMRLKDKGLSFPRQLMLGAIQGEEDIELMGLAIGKQLQALGVHINFAPVADINNNPLNPVIGDRSFGEDREEAARKSVAYMRGLQTAGVMASGKHFPGHGDTDVDSHYDLPVIQHTMERLEDIELYPFRQLIDEGIGSIMVAHLHVPAIDSTANMSTTLSPLAVRHLLKEKMGFKGLVITDALEMQGVTKHFSDAEIAVMAFAAGNDILLLPRNIDEAFKGLKDAFTKGKLQVPDLNQAVRKILVAKYELGLHQHTLPDPASATSMAFDPNAVAIKHKLIEQAITVVQNRKALIPLVDLLEPKTATLAIGVSAETTFQKRLSSYLDADHFNSPHRFADRDAEAMKEKLKSYDRIIVSIHRMTNKAADRFGLTQETLNLIQELNKEKDIILVVFGSPYSLAWFENIGHLVMAYEDQPETQDLTAQALVGVFGCSGKLPVTASPIFPVHSGYTTPSLKRLGYSIPERVGMNAEVLKEIGDIAKIMITAGAAPGAQVLIARHGRIVYEEAFGKHRYQGNDTVRLTDIYDLASVTKVAAATLSVMRLDDENVISIEKSLGRYLPWLDGSNKERLQLKKVMAHFAGLKAWIPFYQRTVPNKENEEWLRQQTDIYCDMVSSQYSVQVARDMFIDADYLDSMRMLIRNSPMNPEGKYVYSDLGFIMLAEIIERESGVPLDVYADSVFYRPLGLQRIGFRPYNRFSENEIAPSELDNYFRCQEVTGYVHDMASAMFGGVSGHAGLFSNAHDLAVVFQMLLNEGEYGGRKFIEPSTLAKYTKRFGRSTRRGIGFDMKELAKGKSLLMAQEASASAYGHTGFTGVCAWNDPDEQLLFVFLSNRTYPSMENNKLRTLRIREKVHTRAYRSIQSYAGYSIERVHG